MLDDAELEGAFNEKTKMIIINTPHNPMGKVFNRFDQFEIDVKRLFKEKFESLLIHFLGKN